MKENVLLSETERKLFLSFFLFVCLIFYIHLITFWTAEIDRQIKFEEMRKTSTSMFSIGYEPTPPLKVRIFWIQFLYPFLFLVLRKPKLPGFAAVTFINCITTYSIAAWNQRNYEAFIESVSGIPGAVGYFEKLPHFTAFLLALFSFALLVVQISILLRFGFENYRTKISSE